MKPLFDIQLSLEQLEKNYWNDPKKFPTPLVEKCYNFRKIPVKDLSTGQLRTLIGQNIGLPYLIPLAIEILKTDILAEGDFYPGDLLNSVISADNSFWKNNKTLWNEVIYLLEVHKQKLTNEILDRESHRKIDTFKKMFLSYG
jgi:hypothetical protein